MGHHYVPQKYLEGFATTENGTCVWQYDKQERRFTQTPVAIKKVAQKREFYEADTERRLNEIVERPGNLAIDKLRAGEQLTDEDRRHLAIYIATMAYRVPRKRHRGEEMLSSVIPDTIADVRRELTAAAARTDVDQAVVEARLAELDAAEEKLQRETPEELMALTRSPWASAKVIISIYAMKWHFVPADGRSFYITSDNPVFFFEQFGLGSTDSELTFPVSPQLALFGSWRTTSRPCGEQMVKEVNRRTASEATRFLYSHTRTDWIPKIADKRHHRLNLIR